MSLSTTIRDLFGTTKAVVLMYHRIASPPADPWQLSVSRSNFEDQLKMLKEEFEVKPVAKVVDELRTSAVKRNTVCITFDDGYEDNLLFAIPLLEKYGLPATFFIPSAWLGGKPFWWDVLGEVFLETKKLPGTLDIEIMARRIKHQITGDAGQRNEVFADVWSELRDKPLPEIEHTVNDILNWSGVVIQNTLGNYSLTSGQLKKLASSRMATIGVHTATHPALASLSREAQQNELNNCRSYLDQLLGSSHELVAYPYGNYNSDTLDIIRNGKYRAAFTTEAKAVTAKSDVAMLGRFQVVDQTGKELKSKIKNWLN